MSRFAERLREEGMQQGKHQGDALVSGRQPRPKFGELPDTVQRHIEQANGQTLL
ncbi:MAG: transposase [Candidatus Thiosymbion ectosymbiont of Robbea hypermnestra]|nr:transposase [Candidatus Thiosymbion ectosymbiont of Robbea hypermnestra]